MGSFIIRPTQLIQGGSPYVQDTAVPATYSGWMASTPTNNGLLLGIQSETGFSYDINADVLNGTYFSDTLRFNCTGACIYLNGSSIPISSGSLPNGFRLLTAYINVIVGNLTSGGHFYLQQANNINGTIDEDIFPYEYLPSVLSILLNACGFKVLLLNDNAFVQIVYDLKIAGTYDIFGYSWNIKNGSTPIKQANGSLLPIKVTVQSPSTDSGANGGPTGINTGGLDGIIADTGSGQSSITINYYKLDGTLVQRTIPTTDIIVQENIILIFIINIITLQLIIDDLGNAINTTTFYLTATGNGVQFSGSVPLGTLSILLVDASGIYKITENKRNDTLYSNHDGTTFDSAIPNPFVKGGFIGG